ncbi:diaminopimelate epimerase [Nannocystaceae bacterium ST9]
MAAVSFSKVEGLGNDFILLDRLDHAAGGLVEIVAWARAIAPRICERRTGIGADGILIVGAGQSEDSLGTMIVVNADGSRPEMCGNGLRCVAAFLAGRYKVDAVRIDTDAGGRDCRIVGRSANATDVAIDMGPATSLGKRSPKAGGGREFIGIGVGNPHAICFVSGEDDLETLARSYGPAIETDAAYLPDKTNVEFAAREPDGSLTLWVWERGVGITQACGTGACATAAAAVREQLLPADAPITVRLPGGALTIVVPSDPRAGIEMTGPSRHVFTGVVHVDDARSS